MKHTRLARASAAILAVAAAATLGGCTKAYTVDVRNMTDQPIKATLSVKERLVTPPQTQQTYIGPQDRAVMQHGNLKHRASASLSVDFDGNIAGPAELPLSAGRTIVNVERVDEGSKGRIRLRQVD